VFNRKSVDETHPLDETIANLISELAGLETGSELHVAAVNSLKVLMEARTADKAAAKPATLSPDMIASIAANLLGIVAILGFEKANVVTSKSLSFVPKINV
jgi:hypothetical protein